MRTEKEKVTQKRRLNAATGKTDWRRPKRGRGTREKMNQMPQAQKQLLSQPQNTLSAGCQVALPLISHFLPEDRGGGQRVEGGAAGAKFPFSIR